MEVFTVYLFKASAILFVFWIIYTLLLQKETTFAENRYFLLSGILIATLLPFLKIKKTVLVELGATTSANAFLGEHTIQNESNLPLDWTLLLLCTYLLGAVFFLFRFGIQLYSIKRLTKHAHIWREADIKHVETQEKIAPFSFFKSLFYCSKQFDNTELEAILLHEKVHARQWHSIDVVLSEILKIVLWFNPLIWYYQRTIQQNLEFLADAHAVNHFSKTSYQYLMVNQATGHQIAITNSFYNSLIKKRIVMLNKNQSKRINALKSLWIIPLLAIFLVSFSTEKVYQFKSNDTALINNAKVELIIDKTTSDEELMKIKTDLAKEGVDFSYTTVRNEAKEIIDISLQVSGEGENGASFKNSHNTSDSKNGISPLVVFIDLKNNLVSIGTKGAHTSNVAKIKKGEDMVWISSDDADHKEVIIKEKNGEKKMYINGEEVDKDELHEHDVNLFIEEGKDDADNSFSFHISTDEDEEHVKVKKRKSKKGQRIMVVKDSDNDTDIEVLGEEGFFFIDTEGKAPLYIINGKEASRKEVKKLSPKEIESINVLKGKSATKKYGKKAKDGVVEIVSKK